jgi:hypothetical protein
MRFLITLLFITSSLLGTRHIQAQEAAEPSVVNALDGIFEAFSSYSIVAIGEQHGIRELGDFYQAILRDARFVDNVDAVVLEYGNALFQDVIDRYMNGENIPYEDLQRVWSDAVGKIPGGTEVMYVQLFTTLRSINANLPAEERIRVLLGDPPIDWSTVDSKEDVIPVQMQRESHFAGVVINEVLDKGLKALVITGAPHLDRSPAMPNAMPFTDNSTPPPPVAPMLIMQQIVEQQYPGQTFVIVVHTGFVEDDCNGEIETRMTEWNVSTLAYVKGSWLEGITCTKFPAARMIMTNQQDNQMIGAPSEMPAPKSIIAGADAYLFVGSRDELTMSPFDPVIYLDIEYFTEMSRRHEILFGVPLDWTRVAQENPHYYTDNFPDQ